MKVFGRNDVGSTSVGVSSKKRSLRRKERLEIGIEGVVGDVADVAPVTSAGCRLNS